MALSGDGRVATHTREQVRSKATELGYVYNRNAASLATGVTGLIGLAVHNLNNPYFTRVCSAIEHELEKNGKFALLCNLDESLDKQKRFLNALREQNADGLIICPAVGSTISDIAIFDDVGETVLFARDLPGSNYDFVGNEDRQSMDMATTHLLELGHRRIGFIYGGDATTVSQDRFLGFMDAHERMGVSPDKALIVKSSLQPRDGEAATQQLMQQANPPSAIACFTDYLALGAISCLHSLGYKPGVDVAVIGCDGIPEGERSYLGLSTINVQKKKLGRTAASLLISRLADASLPKKSVRIAPLEKFRRSCGQNNP